jgi:hypothetical protein
MNPTSVLTLVHGTWARNAAWTEADSPLGEALKRGLQNDVKIERFEWSGKNSHRARSQAGRTLEQHILGFSKRYPGIDQFIIAHSHGGNVVLYALRNPDVRKQIRGTICLSTPFILCRSRDLDSASVFSLWVFVFFGYLITVLWPIGRLLPDESLSFHITIAVTILLYIYILILVGLRRLKPAWLQRGLSELLSDLSNSFRLPNLEPSELFVVRAPGDEASSGLAAIRLFSVLYNFASRTLGRVSTGALWLTEIDQQITWKQRLRVVMYILSIAGGISLLALWMDQLAPEKAAIITYKILRGDLHFATYMTDWRFIIYTAPMCLAALSVIFLVPYVLYSPKILTWLGVIVGLLAGGPLMLLIVLLSIVTAPFGFDAALLAGLFELSAETTPPGNFNVFQLSPDTVSQGLQHGLPYSDAAALDIIVNWISGYRTKASAF